MIAGILVSPIPTAPLTAMAGRLFGLWPGVAVSLLSATLGALAAFYLSRTLGVHFFRRFPEYARFQNLLPDGATAWTIFLLRIPPSPTFDAVSYLAGLTPVSPWKFATATFFGMVPMVIALCAFGTHLPGKYLWPAIFGIYGLWVVAKVVRGKKVPLPGLARHHSHKTQ